MTCLANCGSRWLQFAAPGQWGLREMARAEGHAAESQVPSSSSLMVAGGRNFLTEPLSKSELFRNSSLAGCTTEMVCNVTVGRVDSYLWSKDHKPLPGTDHYQLSRKTMYFSY
ncbi:unnamed protein product [Eretmochelys imbricata]